MLVRAATHFIAHGTAGAACTRHSLHTLFSRVNPIKPRAHRAARPQRYVLNLAATMLRTILMQTCVSKGSRVAELVDFASEAFLRDPKAGVALLRSSGPVVATRFPI